MLDFTQEFVQCSRQVEVIMPNGSIIFKKEDNTIHHFGSWGMDMQALLVEKEPTNIYAAIAIISEQLGDDTVLSID